jgi:hypothetical protein
MTTTRAEYTIEVTNPDGSKWTLEPIMQGVRDVAVERLCDLQATIPQHEEIGQVYRLVKREVTLTEWEPV